MAQAPKVQNRRRPKSAGASRKAAPRNWRPLMAFIAKGTMLVCAAAGLVGLVVWLDPMAQLRQLTDRPIAGVTIEAEFEYVSQQKVQDLVAGKLTKNFLKLDMADIKQAMEQDPWIETASLSRQWPDRLVVRVKEQEPIARWGKTGFVNQNGEIIEVGDNSVLANLPLLYGEDKYAKEVMQNYLQISRLLAPAELKLSAVYLDETLSWTLQLQSDLIVRVGRNDVFPKLQRLIDVYTQKLSGKSQQIASIDLRYENGFAVAWKDSGIEQLAAAGK